MLNLKTDLAKAIQPVAIKNLELLDRKQQDYGSRNLTEFGTMGVVVRMSDKMERIKNLLKRNENVKEGSGPNPLNEPIADSFLDLANYAYIAYVMHTKKWPVDTPPSYAVHGTEAVDDVRP